MKYHYNCVALVRGQTGRINEGCDGINVFRTSIKARLILIFVCCAILPILVQGIVVNRMYAGKLVTKLNEASVASLERFSGEMALSMQKQSDMSWIYASSDDLKQILSGAEKSPVNARINGSLLTNAISTNLHNSDLQMSLLLVTPQSLVYSDLEFSDSIQRQIAEAVMSERWYKDSFKNQSNALWLGRVKNHSPRGSSYTFSLARHLVLNGEYIGSVIVSVDDYLYTNLFDKLKLNSSSTILLVDDQGGILLDSGDTSGGKQLLATSGFGSFLHAQQAGSKGYELKSVGSVNYLVSYCSLPSQGWFLVSFTPADSVLSELKNIQIIPFLLLGLMLVLLVAFALILSREIFDPIVVLSKNIRRVRRGDLDAQVLLPYDNEIGELGKGFNEMTLELKRTIGQIKTDEEQKRLLEVKALEAQIKPHFIYNTLNSIKWMAEMQNAPGITNAIVALVHLIEYNTSSTETLAKVCDEIEALKSYVSLQQLRYWTGFEVVYDVDNDAQNLLIPKLSLQPIVENSIGHGVAQAPHKGEITVSVHCDDETLRITVRDNGVGIPPEKIKRLLAEKPETGSAHLGGMALYNVNQRIRLRYGEPFGLALASEPGAGTTVTILLPAEPVGKGEETQDEDHDH